MSSNASNPGIGVWLWAATLSLLTFVAGCASSSSSRKAEAAAPEVQFSPASQESLAPFRDRDLQVSRLVLNGTDIKLAGAPPMSLRFTGPNRVAGQAAVNRYFGTFQMRDDGTVQWPNAAFGTTRMAGSEPAMLLEQQYLQALAGTTAVLVSPGGVRFQNADGSNLVEFAR